MEPIAVEVLRGDTVESVHRASVAVADARGRRVAWFGNPRLVTFLRSTAKPFQSLAVLETGAADRFGFSSEELAIVTASHNGEDRHVKMVQGILERIRLGPEALQCGPHPPYGKRAAETVGASFTALHNNCSGKHAGMLAVCQHQGWDTRTYLDPSHPLQQSIRQIVADETRLPSEDLLAAIDGCSAPTYAVPLGNAARVFARFTTGTATTRKRREAFERIREALVRHPDLVAGEDRVDTRFMRALGGDVWVKAGGEAIYAMGVKSLGVGIAVKIEDGAGRAVPLLLFRILEELGVLDGPPRAALEPWVNEAHKNWAGRTVGRFQCNLRLRRPRLPAAVAKSVA